MPTKKNSLEAYHQRRDFLKTPEPHGVPQGKEQDEQVFVIQKHASRSLHYDFRIEIDGVLKSWAIPKGVPESGERHLALETEDHPLEYADFEGEIPVGEYGAGQVEIFDKGVYHNIKKRNNKTVPIEQCFKDGRIELWLEGKRLHGAYALIRTQSDEKEYWLFLKMKEHHA